MTFVAQERDPFGQNDDLDADEPNQFSGATEPRQVFRVQLLD